MLIVLGPLVSLTPLTPAPMPMMNYDELNTIPNMTAAATHSDSYT